MMLENDNVVEYVFSYIGFAEDGVVGIVVQTGLHKDSGNRDFDYFCLRGAVLHAGSVHIVDFHNIGLCGLNTLGNNNDECITGSFSIVRMLGSATA